MDQYTKIGSTLFESLVKLREEKGTLDMLDVGKLFEQISDNLIPSYNGVDHKVKEEIAQLSTFINQAMNEISDIRTHDGQNATGDATLHLNAIIKNTEEASHTIMDAVETIQTAANSIGGENEKIITDEIIKIYEACNFQDLTGQRINKVIKILMEIDSKIHNISKLFNSGNSEICSQTANKKALTEDEKLLNGPQLPDIAPSQIDIDALFRDNKI